MNTRVLLDLINTLRKRYNARLAEYFRAFNIFDNTGAWTSHGTHHNVDVLVRNTLHALHI